MIYKSKQGRTIGKFSGGTFKKEVSRKKHLMRKLNSWGIQEEVLKELPDETRIEIFDKDERIIYKTTAKEFREGCTYLQFGDFGLQAFLPLEKFRTEKATSRVLMSPQWV